MLIAQLAVVFVGIAGNHGKAVERQLQPIIEHAHLESAAIPAPALLSLAHHDDASRDIVRNLHVGGLVGGELLELGNKLTLRLVIYDGKGTLKSLGETPIGGHGLSRDDLEVIGSNLADEIDGLGRGHHDHDHDNDAPAPQPAIVNAVAAPKSSPPQKRAEISFDDETPPGLDAKPKAKAAVKPPKPEPEPVAPADPHHDAAPVETADAVSLDDVEALTGGGGNVTDTLPTPTPNTTLHLHAGLGIGLSSRSFAPGPSTVAGYSSSPVGAVHFEGGAEPTANTSVNVIAESTLAMNTPLSGAMAATTMSRWEVAGGYTAWRSGSAAITPTIGVGHRAFSIDSTDPARTPDGDYTYLMLGATASKSLSKRLSLRGVMMFEPVVGGDEPTQMAFGGASRWAIDAGAALELRPIAHVFARIALDYQRFAWSWDAAGARGAGGAVDSYPSGTLALGAEY